MHTVLVGINYKTTHVDSREKMYFPPAKLETALPLLTTYPAINECVIVSTCNRIEVYAVTENVELAYKSIINFLSEFHKQPKNTFVPHLYYKRCGAAVNHLFNVVSSLDSMIVGEYEILGQVKTAYEIAQCANVTKEFSNKLFQMATVVGKKVRTDTAIGKGSISVGSVAVNLVKEIFPEDTKLNVMLVGAGAVAELTAANLVGKVRCDITITNRSKNKATEFAEKFNATMVDFEEKEKHYAKQDVIIFSTGAEEYVLKHEEIELLNFKKGERLVLVDLSVPRNIDPAIGHHEGIYLNTIDDLEKIVDTSMDERSKEVTKAEEIIKEHETKFYDWYNKQAIVPVMREIKKEFTGMQAQLFETYSKELNGLTELQRKVIGKMMESYSDKIIKTIMLNLKEVTDPATLHNVGDMLKKTFNIQMGEKMHHHSDQHPHHHEHSDHHSEHPDHPHHHPHHV